MGCDTLLVRLGGVLRFIVLEDRLFTDVDSAVGRNSGSWSHNKHWEINVEVKLMGENHFENMTSASNICGSSPKRPWQAYITSPDWIRGR